MLDIVFVMDTSGSIDIVEFDLETTFMKNVISQLDIRPIAINVGIANFASIVVEELPLNLGTSRSVVETAIDNVITIGNGTRTDRAIPFAWNMLNTQGRANVPNVLILLTDGGSDARFVSYLYLWSDTFYYK